jgi:hypothetical protein
MKKKKITVESILTEVEPLIDHLADCDGTSRVFVYRLTKAKIAHKVKTGVVLYDGQVVIQLHYWIELWDGRILDIRARSWSRMNNAPHGVFFVKDHPGFEFSGKVIKMDVDDLLFKILMEPFIPGEFFTPNKIRRRD